MILKQRLKSRTTFFLFIFTLISKSQSKDRKSRDPSSLLYKVNDYITLQLILNMRGEKTLIKCYRTHLIKINMLLMRGEIQKEQSNSYMENKLTNHG